jgi:Lysine methyltransferase
MSLTDDSKVLTTQNDMIRNVLSADSTQAKQAQQNMNSILRSLHVERMQRLQPRLSRLELRLNNPHETKSAYGAHIIVSERVGESIGSILWEGSVRMSQFLYLLEQVRIGTCPTSNFDSDEKNELLALCVSNKRIVELGAGIGTLGILAGRLGASHVALTERSILMPLLRANVEANRLADSASDSFPNPSCHYPLGDDISVYDHTWGADVCSDGLKPPYDIVLASDVVYNVKFLDELVTSISNLGGPNSIVLLAYRERGPHEAHFFTTMKQRGFKMIDIVSQYHKLNVQGLVDARFVKHTLNDSISKPEVPASASSNSKVRVTSSSCAHSVPHFPDREEQVQLLCFQFPPVE